MKSVYKSIDLNKVTKKNFKSILTQFNNLSFEESYNELAKMKLKKKVSFDKSVKINHSNKRNSSNSSKDNIKLMNNSHNLNNIKSLSTQFANSQSNLIIIFKLLNQVKIVIHKIFNT